MHVVNLNIAIDSLPTLQISLGIVALFLKRFMMVSRFLPSSQISGRMYVQYRCFNEVYDMKSVSQPDTMPILDNIVCK